MRKSSYNSQSSLQSSLRFPRIFAGIKLDFKERAPQYFQDWKDSLNYRVIPATVETYFNNMLPALAFAQDMFDRTNNSYGVNEVLLSSAIAGMFFGLFSGQPLCIVGVTGPISIFNYTVYEIIKPLNIHFFGFMFWICIWSMIFHFIVAATNLVVLLQYVTQFPCDIFGLFINVVYCEKGIQILTRQFKDEVGDSDPLAGFASIVVALCMMIIGLAAKWFNRTPFFNKSVRTFVSDYATCLSVLFFSGFIHFGGYLDDVHFKRLPITKSFAPTEHVGREGWLAYKSIGVGNVFLALPFGIILTILFYFDHNVSSLMAQRVEYKLSKNSSFHYDFFLLGITTGLSGVLGIPAPNGLIPQAPLHTESLLIRDKDGQVVRCVEQRFSNSVQGLMLLGTMTRPLLVCLGLIPQAVLAGLFFIMGIGGLNDNEIVQRIRFVFTEDKDPNHPLFQISTKKLCLFICFSLVGFVAEFSITNTKGAIGFPLILLLSVIGTFFFPKVFTKREIEILDAQVAEDFTLKNLLVENLKHDGCI